MNEPAFDDFVVIVRQSGLPLDGIDLKQLFDGYLKFQAMIHPLKRPSDLETGLAVLFRPEPVK